MVREKDKQLTMEEKKEQFALSNEFVRMPNRLTAPELKVFYHCLTKISWSDVNEKSESGMIKVSTSVNEVRKAIGSASHDYRYYVSLLEELQIKAWIRVDINGFFRRAVIIPDVEIRNNQEIDIYINDRLTPFIENLHKYYTVYELANTAKFQSRFALILYMNLLTWNDHSPDRKDELDERERYYTTAQLWRMFDLKEGDYHDKQGVFKRPLFEKYVVKRAVEEINSKNVGIRIFWHKKRNGRYVDKYIFRWITVPVEEETKSESTVRMTDAAGSEYDQAALDLPFYD